MLSITHKWSSEQEAELDIGEAGDASSDDDVPWRRVFGSCEVATELGQLGEIQGEREPGVGLAGFILHQLIKQIHLGRCKRQLRRGFRL